MVKPFRAAALVIAAALSLADCNRTEAPKDPVKTYQMRGQVLGVDPAAHTAKIKHEKIEGWMEAMTMDYPVKDDAELKKLTPGEAITATVYVQGVDYWVANVAAATPPTPPPTH